MGSRDLSTKTEYGCKDLFQVLGLRGKVIDNIFRSFLKV